MAWNDSDWSQTQCGSPVGGTAGRASAAQGTGAPIELPGSGAATAPSAASDPTAGRIESRCPRRVTLLNLVAELAVRRSEGEVVEAVMDLVERRRVRLVGQFREEHIREEPRGVRR